MIPGTSHKVARNLARGAQPGRIGRVDRVVLRDRGDELQHPLGRIQTAARSQRIEKSACLEGANQVETGIFIWRARSDSVIGACMRANVSNRSKVREADFIVFSLL